MVGYDELTWFAVTLLLAGVVVLATAAAYSAEARRGRWLWFCLAAIWLVACVVAFAINPTTWPLPRA